jgi:hypothetical protein
MVGPEIKPRVKGINREHIFQAALNRWLRVALPAAPEAWFTGFDAGAHSDPRAGDRAKARGVKAGVPDMLVKYKAPETSPSISVWFELKAAPNKVVPDSDQARVIQLLRALGDEVHVIYSILEAHTALRCAGVPLLATAISANVADMRWKAEVEKQEFARTRAAPRLRKASSPSLKPAIFPFEPVTDEG